MSVKVIVEFRRCLKLECMGPDIKDRGILREKKQSEIMQILGQSTGNITSQKTYIHRELGADSLRQPIPLSAGVDETRGRA